MRVSSTTPGDILTALTESKRDKLESGVLVPGVPPPTEYSRNYQSVPQPGLNNRPQFVYSAAVVGGGTVINGMFFNRGSATDYDSWLKLGNPGWGLDDLLPYFKKSETFTPAPEELSAQYPISDDLAPHGTDGPVQSSFAQYQYPVLRKSLPAAQRASQNPISAMGLTIVISGVGPRKLLKGLGIKVIQDLPGVGYNFQDQPTMFAGVTYDYSKYPLPTPSYYVTNQSWVAEQLEIYYQNRTGPATLPYLSGSTVPFLSLQRLTDQHQQIIQSAKQADLRKALPAGADMTLLEGYKAQQSAILADYGSPDTAVYETGMLGNEVVPLTLIKPLSRGSILINSSDPLTDPVFDYGTFQHPADMQVFIASYKKFRQFVGAEPWKAVGLQETLPGPSVQGDGAIEAAIRNITVSTWSHPVGTCAMMPKEHGGVLDPQLRVYGIKGLSVVDASMMPIIPATHTSAPVYAVAEKAADLIKQGRRRSARRHSKIAVVCSARSGVSKAGGTTNRLLKAARDASRPSSSEYKDILSKLQQEHVDAATCISSQKIIQRYQADVAVEFDHLIQVLDSMPRTGIVDPQSEDRVVSVGEKLSSRLLAALLSDRGVPSRYIDLSDTIDFPVPDHLSQIFYRDLSASFGRLLSTHADTVPVVTGFFGPIPGGLVNSLGRGYSDLCAALVAVGLSARELQVWKEVDGVFTADPRKVPTARLLPTLTPHEAGELTFYGSEVIHNFTLQQCIP
ncbi:MAG: hypothetical protein Q9177_005350, partial [Variospora cf. flavescens]